MPALDPAANSVPPPPIIATASKKLVGLFRVDCTQKRTLTKCMSWKNRQLLLPFVRQQLCVSLLYMHMQLKHAQLCTYLSQQQLSVSPASAEKSIAVVAPGYQVDERLRRRNTDTSPTRRASGLEGDTPLGPLGDSPDRFSGHNPCCRVDSAIPSG